MTIDNGKVTELFNKRASTLSGNNSVLSSNQNPRTILQNIYRDYITKNTLLKHLQVNKTDTLLDFGCCVGRLSKHTGKKCKSVLAVDTSEKMIANAINTTNLSNVTYRTISGDLSFCKKNSISKVYTCWVLQHVSDTALNIYMDEFYRVLNNNGKIVIMEQTSKTSYQNDDVIIQRKSSDYVNLFKLKGFSLVYSKKVFKVPSYAMDYWIKLNPPLFLLPFFGILERLTISRKQDATDYFTEVFVFKKVTR